jgi:nitroreductase
MTLRELVLRTRSYRRFHEEITLERSTLEELVDLARLSASGNNKQPLKYRLAHDPQTNALIFPLLAWAGYLQDWPGPAVGERPSAYIIVLGDTHIASSFGYDCGIAVQNILLGATEMGWGGCLIGSVRRDHLRQVLDIPDHYEILLVVALGKPAEEIKLEAVQSDENIRYWRDPDGVHHVPKRSLADIIIG